MSRLHRSNHQLYECYCFINTRITFMLNSPISLMQNALKMALNAYLLEYIAENVSGPREDYQYAEDLKRKRRWTYHIGTLIIVGCIFGLSWQ